MSLFADDMISYIENLKNPTKKKKKNLFEVVNKFCKVLEYKINRQKSIAFVYASNETSEKEIKNPI